LIPTILRIEIPEVSIKDDTKIELTVVNFIINSNIPMEVPIVGSDSLNIAINGYKTPSYDIFFDETKIQGLIIPHVRGLLRNCVRLIGDYLLMFESI
jgi:hypothetical protein